MKKNLSLFFALPFVLAACVTRMPPRVALPEAESSRVLDNLRLHLKNQELLQGARGYARVKLKLGGKGAGAEEAVFIALPDRFRFETLDDLGNRRFVLFGGEGRFFARDEGKPSERLRELEEKDLKRFLPLKSDVEETLGLFLGKIPPLNLEGARVYPELKDSTFRIVLPEAEVFWDDAQGLILSLDWKEERGKLAYRYEGGEFARASFRRPSPSSSKDPLLAPMRVRLTDLKTKNWVEIRYLSLEWNPDLSPSLFRVNPLEDGAGSDDQD